MWNLVQPPGHPSPSLEYEVTTNVATALVELQHMYRDYHVYWDIPSKVTELDLYKNFDEIFSYITDKTVLYTWLRNIPNMTFEQIMDKVGSRRKHIIHSCTYNRNDCANFTQFGSGQFPRCFHYDISAHEKNTQFEDEINSGITFLLMTGVQLMSVAFKQIRSDHNTRFSMRHGELFEDVLSTVSANGIRLTINSQGAGHNVNQQGINLSPGYYTLVAIKGREIIRLPWPYSDCVTVDYEIKRLQESVKETLGFTSTNKKQAGSSSYSQQECRSSCLQRLIVQRCHCLSLEYRLPFPDMENTQNRHLCGALGPDEMAIFLSHGKSDCFKNFTVFVSNKCMFLHSVINQLACVQRVKEAYIKKKASSDSDCLCPPACYTYEYDLSTSQSIWPAAGYELDNAYKYHVYGPQWNYTFGPGKQFTGCLYHGTDGIANTEDLRFVVILVI